MGNLSDIDWDDIDENKAGGFELLPLGDYLVEIREADTKDNKAGNGTYLALTFEVIDGDHHGRRIWENLTLSHPTQTAVDIGKAKLKRLIKTLGFNGINDSSELQGCQLQIKVGQRKRKDTGDLQNEIKSYAALPAPEAKAPKPAANGSRAPWAKK